MIIYKITNKINGKIYIGQTRSTLKKRFNQHCEKRNNTAISLAIKKYGKLNFEIEIIYNNILTIEELNKKEIECISKYNSLSPNGYNVEIGGNQSKQSEETKIKKSKKLKGRRIEWSEKIKISVKELWEDPEYRERQTKQRHEKRGKYRKGIKKDKLKKNINIENFQKDYHDFVGLDELSDKYNISINTIYKIIKREDIKKRGYKCNIKKD